MTDLTAAALAPRIDLAVTATEGVRETYSARPLVARAVERAVDAEGSLAAVEEVDGARSITVCIGVSDQDDTVAVASAVAAAVRGTDDEAAGATVRVRVGRLVAPAT
ncbi:hypothetical protein AB0O90_06165 [Microbacterium testaceum]|uniref:hypothetical protein n=1 Tax=Microbacterium testaceum TaxID=2033 RepID=UPI003435553C